MKIKKNRDIDNIVENKDHNMIHKYNLMCMINNN